MDVGFGDVMVPEPAEIEYPTLLDFPPPILNAYTREAVIVEKLEALTALGLLNSRLKDCFDLWLLSRLSAFAGHILVAAINATFGRRGTQVDASTAELTDSFAPNPAKAIQWKASLRRSRFSDRPHELIEVVSHVRASASPPLPAAAARTEFRSACPAGGPWI
ncbi:MAG: nucleotidyl transferase AbiEii/AbiGii toxin family protein [Acidobacteria bacterium]|nr:nucleotidyl transferase AbiEii/AbiGii toxin family protein [Acidobacteriota bacterium]